MALVYDVYCDFVTFPFGILGQVWYLIVSIPDPCCLSYFAKDFFKIIVGKPSFSDQLKKITQRYTRVGFSMDIMRQSACLVANPITVDKNGFLFIFTTEGQAPDLMTALTFNPLVGAWCLSLSRPTVAQLEGFFSSDFL